MDRFTLITTIHSLIWLTVSSSTYEVAQTPPDLLRKPGEPAELQCSHSISGYDYILWCSIFFNMMTLKNLIIISLSLCQHFGSALCNVVQNPLDLIQNQHGIAEIKCAHTVKSYDRILWYKHTQATGFKYMGYLYTMIIKNLITISFLICWHFGSALCNVVQNPLDLIKNQNDTAEIKCAHSVKDYERILWYKHTQATKLKLMGYLHVQTPNNEAEFEKKITLSGDGRNNGSLIISSLSVNDSAVYYCAAYYIVL
ncbi:hypothetical protein MHYP_G00133160 [Metynnis hypsauchen]